MVASISDATCLVLPLEKKSIALSIARVAESHIFLSGLKRRNCFLAAFFPKALAADEESRSLEMILASSSPPSLR